ncbi:NAD(P)-dependent oxidoreductase [Fructilactobacillus sanfranciscensis]|uniref:NAD(P)-dependent oxidoreductase n=1 Tax=Fructilactobacillus sanfranciscensis TaxID=1625 RepID=UPI0031FA1320
MKITAYGVRPIEVQYFEKLNIYNYQLNLVPEMLSHENAIDAKGSDAVLLRGTCVGDRENLAKFKSWGIDYVFTRTVGFDHVDLKAAKELGIKVARVPGYSPYAVAELAMTLGMTLFRNVSAEMTNTHDGNFKVLDSYFSREIHSSTVGIIGCGRIGATEASLYAGMGTRVIGYDKQPDNEPVKNGVDLVSLEELLKESDIISLHVPFIPGNTENMIDTKELEMTKDDAILINTARAQVVNMEAVTDALINHKIGGYGADVLVDEGDIFGKDFAKLSDLPNVEVYKMMDQFPNVIVTPHVGSFTKPALEDMISVSYKNFHEVLETGTCANELV